MKFEGPDGWTVGTPADMRRNLEAIEFGSPEFKALALEVQTEPLIFLTRWPEPWPELNPSFSVKARQGRVSDPTKLLVALEPSLRGLYPDIEYLQAPVETAVGGKPAATMTFTYTLRLEGVQDGFPVHSRIWIVPLDEHFLMVGSGLPFPPPPDVKAMIDATMASISFE